MQIPAIFQHHFQRSLIRTQTTQKNLIFNKIIHLFQFINGKFQPQSTITSPTKLRMNNIPNMTTAPKKRIIQKMPNPKKPHNFARSHFTVIQKKVSLRNKPVNQILAPRHCKIYRNPLRTKFLKPHPHKFIINTIFRRTRLKKFPLNFCVFKIHFLQINHFSFPFLYGRSCVCYYTSSHNRHFKKIIIKTTQYQTQAGLCRVPLFAHYCEIASNLNCQQSPSNASRPSNPSRKNPSAKTKIFKQQV